MNMEPSSCRCPEKWTEAPSGYSVTALELQKIAQQLMEAEYWRPEERENNKTVGSRGETDASQEPKKGPRDSPNQALPSKMVCFTDREAPQGQTRP